jgi:hypothetical protein
MSFGVGEEAVEGADDMAHVEGYGGEWIGVGGGTGVEGIVGERLAPVFDVLSGELEGMNYGTDGGGEVGVGSAEPGFHGYRVQSTGYRAQRSAIGVQRSKRGVGRQEVRGCGLRVRVAGGGCRVPAWLRRLAHPME